MQREVFVALQLEVPHHFIERCAGGRSRRLEPPATFGATKTPKTLLLNPHQVPAHGLLCRRALSLSDCIPWYPLALRGCSPFAATDCLLAAEDRQPVRGGGKCLKGMVKFTCANWDGLSGTLHTRKILVRRTPDFRARLK
jgi:hypothetical protein